MKLIEVWGEVDITGGTIVRYVSWDGGKGWFILQEKAGSRQITIEYGRPDIGLPYQNLYVTPITADGTYPFDLPAGKLRISVPSASGDISFRSLVLIGP